MVLMPQQCRMLKMGRRFTRPTPAGEEAPFREQGRSERRGKDRMLCGPFSI